MTDTLATAATHTLRFTKWVRPARRRRIRRRQRRRTRVSRAIPRADLGALLHQISRYLVPPAIDTWALEDLAATFGVTQSKLIASLARLERFGMIRTVGTDIEVRTQVSPLPARRIERMPTYLAAACPFRNTTTGTA